MRNGSALYIVRYIRKLCGCTQSILAEGSDGRLYVVKFANNPQGPNIPFNESVGSELYRACGLTVPEWKPLLVTNSFLESNPACWIAMPTSRLVPNAGWCFGSRFLGSEGKRLLEILPGSSIARVRNVWNFWLAWLVDICADHADHRQALFEERPDGRLSTVFIDHGHLFGGPHGIQKCGPRVSRYLDARIYRDLSSKNIATIQDRLKSLKVDLLWQQTLNLPDEWRTKTALDSFSECLGRLSSVALVQTLVDEVIEVHNRSTLSATAYSSPILRSGIQTIEASDVCRR